MNPRIFSQKSYWSAQFQTWTDLIDYAVRPIPGGEVRDSHASNRYSEDWFGSENWDEAVEIARRGLPDLGKIIAQESAKMSSVIFSKIPRPDVGYDVAGQVIDMGRYLDGVPECVINLDVPDCGHLRTAEILSNQTVSFHQNAENVKNRGIAAATVVKTLEALGVSVRLWVCAGFHQGHYTITCFTRVKDYGEPLFLNRIAVALCSNITHRRLGFAVAENAPEDIRRKIGVVHEGTYGQAVDFGLWKGRDIFPVQKGFGQIPLLDSETAHIFKSIESAKDWVQRSIIKKIRTVT